MAYTYSNLAALRVPDQNAGDDVAAHLSYLVEQLDPAIVGTAASLSDRDSKFYNAPAGYLCKVVKPNDHPDDPNGVIGLYIKTKHVGQVGWYALYEPGLAMVDIPVSLVDGFDPRGVGFELVLTPENERFATLSGAVVKTNGSAIANGDILGYLPVGYYPYRKNQDFGTAVAYNINPGNARISLSGNTGAVTYYGPSTSWVGVDNVRYRLI